MNPTSDIINNSSSSNSGCSNNSAILTEPLTDTLSGPTSLSSSSSSLSSAKQPPQPSPPPPTPLLPSTESPPPPSTPVVNSDEFLVNKVNTKDESRFFSPPTDLLKWKDMPKHLQFNPYVIEGYRPLTNAKGCVNSLLYFHNETINIYTHGKYNIFFCIVSN